MDAVGSPGFPHFLAGGGFSTVWGEIKQEQGPGLDPRLLISPKSTNHPGDGDTCVVSEMDQTGKNKNVTPREVIPLTPCLQQGPHFLRAPEQGQGTGDP